MGFEGLRRPRSRRPCGRVGEPPQERRRPVGSSPPTKARGLTSMTPEIVPEAGDQEGGGRLSGGGNEKAPPEIFRAGLFVWAQCPVWI